MGRNAVVCFVCFLVMAPLTLGQQGRKARLEDKGIFAYVTVAKGELRQSAGFANRSAWRLQDTPQGTALVHETLGGEKLGWYLAYDPDGNDPRVKLVPKLGPGSYWTWSEIRKLEQPGGDFYVACAARAAQGRMKGWSLSFDHKSHLTLTKEKSESVFYRIYVLIDPNSGK